MSKKKRTMTRIEWLIVLGIVLILLAVSPIGSSVWGLFTFPIQYSEGDRVGQVVKLSEKGLIWKTWEGGMGLTQSGAYVEYSNFSIDSRNPNRQEISDQLQRAYTSGELIKVHYDQRLGARPWRGKTTYLVSDIEFIRSKE